MDYASLVLVVDSQHQVICLDPPNCCPTGVASPETVGSPVTTVAATLLKTDELEKFLESLSKVQRTGKSQEIDLALNPSFGYMARLTLKMQPLGKGDRHLGTLIVGRINGKGALSAEQELILRKERFSSIQGICSRLPHLLRNPLSGVLLNAQMLEEEVPQGSALRAYLRDILAATRRIQATLESLYELAHPPEPQRQPMGVRDLVDQALSPVYDQLLRNQVDLDSQFEQGLPPILVDPDQMRLALNHVIVNAVQAMPNGGGLHITGRRGCSGTGGRNTYVEIRVEDTGYGIAPEHLSKVFDPFFSTLPKGSGLGLCVVHTLMVSNGGEVFVTSSEGKGTQVTLRFPPHVRE